MSYTRRQFVEGAYQEIGLDPYEFDIPASLLETGRKRLDAMMEDWYARGIRLGYPIPLSPEDSDLDEETNVPFRANRAIIANLALELAPGRGKTPSLLTVRAAKTGFNTVMSISAMPPEVQLRRLPAGAGNKPWRYGDPFTRRPDRAEYYEEPWEAAE